jgi:hypothetical protein
MKTTFTGKPYHPPRTFSLQYQDVTHIMLPAVPAIMVLCLFAKKNKKIIYTLMCLQFPAQIITCMYLEGAHQPILPSMTCGN